MFDLDDPLVQGIMQEYEITEPEHLAKFLIEHYYCTMQDLYCNVCGNNNSDQAFELIDEIEMYGAIND